MDTTLEQQCANVLSGMSECPSAQSASYHIEHAQAGICEEH